MTDGIRIQLIKVRSFSLKIARKLYSELRKLYSLKSDSIRQYRSAPTTPPFERSSVREAFGRNKVAVLVGDWTDGDPVLGRFIEQHNRAGVPLYLYYAPGAKEPQVLPQVLTPSMLEKLGA